MKSTLSWDGEQRVCQSVRLGLSLETEAWDEASGLWVYGRNMGILASLEIVVDETSGEDGAASPDAHWRLEPLPADLFHSTWTDDAPEFEAWFGNDAPELEENTIELLGRDDQGRIHVRWKATCEGEPMAFEGWAEFAGVSVRVTHPEDARPFLQQTWPGREWPDLSGLEHEVIDYGESFPVERRRWHCFSYPF